MKQNQKVTDVNKMTKAQVRIELGRLQVAHKKSDNLATLRKLYIDKMNEVNSKSEPTSETEYGSDQIAEFKAGCPTFAKSGALDGNELCTACKSDFSDRYTACNALAKPKTKSKSKKTSGLNPLGFRKNSDTDKFCNAIADSALTMKEVKALSWNKRPNTFYVAFNKMKNDGHAKIDKQKRMSLTAKGRKLLTKAA